MSRVPSLGPVIWGAGGGAALRDWRLGARGMQFGVLVDAVLRAGCRGYAIWGASEVLFCKLEVRVLRGIQFGVLVERPRARGHAV